ncbi:DUF1569 domain-containing protein [Flavihumibacter sp. R14]|nr:DUF1569 domain-containing protein [Flavihumibacter soli]
MALPNIFSKEVSEQIIDRINALTPDTPRLWGKMNVSQMLAHCNVAYELVYENRHPKPNFFMKFILKTLVKSKATNDVPYKPSMPTGPAFIIKDAKDFEAEKARLISHILKTRELGETHFDKKESPGFGRLTTAEWNNMFYKHLDHHLRQFGA